MERAGPADSKMILHWTKILKRWQTRIEFFARQGDLPGDSLWCNAPYKSTSDKDILQGVSWGIFVTVSAGVGASLVKKQQGLKSRLSQLTMVTDQWMSHYMENCLTSSNARKVLLSRIQMDLMKTSFDKYPENKNETLSTIMFTVRNKNDTLIPKPCPVPLITKWIA